MVEISFDHDINKKFLTRVPKKAMKLSKRLLPKVEKAGLDLYRELYAYFWELIENAKSCSKCETNSSECLNKYFLTELKQSKLEEGELYILAYITMYFLDLINYYTNDIVHSYYILSKGHHDVFKFLENPKRLIHGQGLWGARACDAEKHVNKYNGYLLSVLNYMIPDFD